MDPRLRELLDCVQIVLNDDCVDEAPWRGRLRVAYQALSQPNRCNCHGSNCGCNNRQQSEEVFGASSNDSPHEPEDEAEFCEECHDFTVINSVCHECGEEYNDR